MPQEPQFTKVIAQKTSKPIKVDGLLDDEIWKTAPIHTAAFDKRNKDTPQEPGTVQFAWDDKNLYMAVKFVDTDIVAEGKEDQLHHYKMGDLAELFLKPEDSTWYWELYVTPHGKKTSFWFPGRGRFGLESSFQYKMELNVGARIEGTL
ncbi:MAG: sugar-binding protein, partial [Planctomycetota bacterium]|nr:sugar-binding protein [Planctomycetota bacterium]